MPNLAALNEYKFDEGRPPVFFMVGSQRSGSNWLRIMTDTSPDIAGPHPPHIIKSFKPILSKYGSLQVSGNFNQLIDHVCLYVERNMVSWLDAEGRPIVFDRSDIRRRCDASIACTISKQNTLISVFAAVMDTYAEQNGAKTWICKSMGLADYHEELLAHFGKRLRYVYLTRDPRDVALSMSKANQIGDSHMYFISMAWRKLQLNCIRVMEESPDIIHRITYESLLNDKQGEMQRLFKFLKAEMPQEEAIDNAHKTREAIATAGKSSLWGNLTRGKSLTVKQQAKWMDPKTGLAEEDLELVESVLEDVMQVLGYDTFRVGVSKARKVYSADQVKEFTRLNQEGISKQRACLAEEDPEDLERRKAHDAILNLPVEVYTF